MGLKRLRTPRLITPNLSLLATIVAASQIIATTYSISAEAETTSVPRHHFTGHSHTYADKFHGKRTASGQLHDKTKFTCAHRTLPFGTHLHVKNKKNGKSCVVVVNDRGPFTPNVILDVSKAAAQTLGFTGGKVPIECTVLDSKVAASFLKQQDASLNQHAAFAWTGGKSSLKSPGSLQGEKIASAGQSGRSVPATKRNAIESTVSSLPQAMMNNVSSANNALKNRSHPAIASDGASKPDRRVLTQSKPEATFLLVINDIIACEVRSQVAETKTLGAAWRSHQPGVDAVGAVKDLNSEPLSGRSKIADQGYAL